MLNVLEGEERAFQQGSLALIRLHVVFCVRAVFRAMLSTVQSIKCKL